MKYVSTLFSHLPHSPYVAFFGMRLLSRFGLKSSHDLGVEH
jgi:hypothetical protein